MKNQKILVTGGAGFIGSHVVDTFLEEGFEVVIVDDLSTGEGRHADPRCKLYKVDVRDKALDEVFALEQPLFVSHHAARVDVRESMDDPCFYTDVNLIGSINVLECCRRHKVRKVLYASSGGAVYGEPDELPVEENHPIRPLDHYGASKHHVEHHLHLYEHNYGLRFTTMRYPNVYGPRQNSSGEAGVVAVFAKRMLTRKKVIINGTGDQERDFIFVKDVARANLLALSKGESKEYNLGHGQGISINELFEKMACVTSYGQPAVYGPEKVGEVFRTCLDASLAGEELGWKPLVGFTQGLNETVASFRALEES